MFLARKVIAAIVVCCSILGFLALANKGGSVQEQPISVSMEIASCKIDRTEKIKISLKSKMNGSDLRFGRVILEFWLFGETPATLPVQFDPINGHTDHQGRFVSEWQPPRPGQYLICARVSKSGCTGGQAASRFVVLEESPQ